jgi:phage terminase large subunit-like protein
MNDPSPPSPRREPRRVHWPAFAGAPCGAGLDLASSCDFAAFCRCFPVDESSHGLIPAAAFDRPFGYYFNWRLWLPEGYQSPQEEKLRHLAAPWATKGWVKFTSGDVIDHDVIESDVLELARECEMKVLAFDPWNATQLSTHLAQEGLNVLKFEQRLQRFAGPSKLFGELLGKGRFFHDGNPAVRWMADNVIVVRNGADQIMPSRKKSNNKIDGIVAGVMALGAATCEEANAEPTDAGFLEIDIDAE